MYVRHGTHYNLSWRVSVSSKLTNNWLKQSLLTGRKWFTNCSVFNVQDVKYRVWKPTASWRNTTYVHVHFYSSLYTVYSSVISYPYAGNNKNVWCNVSAVEKSVTKVITTYKPCKDKILNDRNIHIYYNLNTHSIRYKYWTHPSQCL